MAGKVLVVDDEKMIVKGIKFSLIQDYSVVDCAYDGVAIMDAKDLHFEKKGSLIRITSKDSEGRENETTVSMRSEESGVAL